MATVRRVVILLVDSNNTLYKYSEIFVKNLFRDKLPDWAVYHDLTHTCDTVEACRELGEASGLSDSDLEDILVAGWFHDTGYIFVVDGHEEESSKIALKFLSDYNLPKERIYRIIDCIMATKISNKPKTYFTSIIRDADLITLGRKDYFIKNELLRLEIEKREKREIDEYSWLKRSYKFLSSHEFRTNPAREKYGPQLKENLIELGNIISQYQKED